MYPKKKEEYIIEMHYFMISIFLWLQRCPGPREPVAVFVVVVLHSPSPDRALRFDSSYSQDDYAESDGESNHL